MIESYHRWTDCYKIQFAFGIYHSGWKLDLAKLSWKPFLKKQKRNVESVLFFLLLLSHHSALACWLRCWKHSFSYPAASPMSKTDFICVKRGVPLVSVSRNPYCAIAQGAVINGKGRRRTRGVVSPYRILRWVALASATSESRAICPEGLKPNTL